APSLGKAAGASPSRSLCELTVLFECSIRSFFPLPASLSPQVLLWGSRRPLPRQSRRSLPLALKNELVTPSLPRFGNSVSLPVTDDRSRHIPGGKIIPFSSGLHR